MVSLTINISNKAVYAFLGIFVVLVVAGFAIGHGSGGPPNVMGHSSEELEMDYTDVQKRIFNTCSRPFFMNGVNQDGSVNCSTDFGISFDFTQKERRAGSPTINCDSPAVEVIRFTVWDNTGASDWTEYISCFSLWRA